MKINILRLFIRELINCKMCMCTLSVLADFDAIFRCCRIDNKVSLIFRSHSHFHWSHLQGIPPSQNEYVRLFPRCFVATHCFPPPILDPGYATDDQLPLTAGWIHPPHIYFLIPSEFGCKWTTVAIGRFQISDSESELQSWKLIRRQNNNLLNVPPSPLYNVDVCMSSLPKVYVMINIVFGGRGEYFGSGY